MYLYKYKLPCQNRSQKNMLETDYLLQTEGADSDEEDDIIKPEDNLLLVGHVESDASILEVYSK